MSVINPTTEPQEQSFSQDADRFLRLREMLWRVGLSRSSVYRLMNTGDFPKQIKLTKNTAVWSENAITAWMNQQKQQAQHDTEIAEKDCDFQQINQGE